MTALRALMLTGVVLLAVVLQVSVFSALSFDGVVPNLALLVVVAAALVRGPEFAAVLGFLGGLRLVGLAAEHLHVPEPPEERHEQREHQGLHDDQPEPALDRARRPQPGTPAARTCRGHQ